MGATYVGAAFSDGTGPSERYYEARCRKKKITDWARQVVFQLRRWLPEQAMNIVGDSTHAALDFLNACQTLNKPVTVITRLRLDAALYEPPPPYSGAGRPRKKGQRLTLPWYNQPARQIKILSGTAFWFHFGLPGVHIRYVLIRDVAGKFDPQALLSTDLSLSPEQILAFFMRRWQMEPTFRHVREHLGVETQRQWSDKAIARTTPVLLGLFSFVTLLADPLFTRQPCTIRASAWYSKPLPTFTDALALVRHRLWTYCTYQMSADDTDMIKVPRLLLDRFNDLLCYAA